ncbi:hypothetical protein P175DRAFT_0531525 [Aspergillus ochraceoroseus IBT 24754]|uniref:Uncharacterized protein n=1 Tax=Aspergillus ochraceoroseus IBT 24754 TaxID=1392256 RepID=A0A2T5M0D4_9EURO|nr:uncharacterized protein P175DRAFT_0531525 [Aspergillus ochraceoroseus IBT 24754]PTU21979.1 hypothetical protein P175DRAFT_0531525 [Aspergillus ochraceoroseus IBT 24754]
MVKQRIKGSSGGNVERKVFGEEREATEGGAFAARISDGWPVSFLLWAHLLLLVAAWVPSDRSRFIHSCLLSPMRVHDISGPTPENPAHGPSEAGDPPLDGARDVCVPRQKAKRPPAPATGATQSVLIYISMCSGTRGFFLYVEWIPNGYRVGYLDPPLGNESENLKP